MHLLTELFLTFAKIGLFTFGGGYAMISVIEDNCVERKKWITHEEMMDMTVIAESTPGPIAINCATFVGYKVAGFRGAVVGTVGMVLPSFLVIYGISLFLDQFLEITLIANAFKGIQVAVGILVLNAGINMIKKMKKKSFSVAVLAFAAAAMLVVNLFSLNISSITLMLFAGLVSLGVYLAKGGRTA